MASYVIRQMNMQPFVVNSLDLSHIDKITGNMHLQCTIIHGNDSFLMISFFHFCSLIPSVCFNSEILISITWFIMHIFHRFMLINESACGKKGCQLINNSYFTFKHFCNEKITHSFSHVDSAISFDIKVNLQQSFKPFNEY